MHRSVRLLLLVGLMWIRINSDRINSDRINSDRINSDRINSDRHEVYWNSTNPRFHGGDYTLEVSINDYLDVLCPHYPEGAGPVENYILYMVNYDGYTSCDRRRGFKRWECNRPLALSPLRFSEKFQLFTAFSLGFEFRPAHEYYYISSPSPLPPGTTCLRLKIYVRPANDSVYESPELFLTDVSSDGVSLSLSLPSALLLLLVLLLSSSS